LEMQQETGPAQRLDDYAVCLVDFESGDERCVREEPAVATDGIGNGQAVALPDHEVLMAVPRGRVYRTGAGIERHVLAENHGDRAILKGMRYAQPLERAPVEFGDGAPRLHSVTLQASRHQLRGENQTTHSAPRRSGRLG